MNQSLLIFADFAPKIKGNIQTIGLQEIDLEKLFNQSLNKAEKNIYLHIQPNIEKVFKSFIANIRIIKAAGGLVKNGEGQYLFIHRLGKWDLPKGKVEENEKMKEAALREVEEECGIKISNGERKLKAIAQNFPVEILFLRDDDIPQYVFDGVAHLGIVGENVFMEIVKNLLQIGRSAQ